MYKITDIDQKNINKKLELSSYGNMQRIHTRIRASGIESYNNS